MFLTFFRVKFVFECDFEISWTLGPGDPGTLGLLDTFPLPSSLFPPPTPPISSSYVWYEGGLSCDIDLYIDVKKFRGWWVVVGVP